MIDGILWPGHFESTADASSSWLKSPPVSLITDDKTYAEAGCQTAFGQRPLLYPAFELAIWHQAVLPSASSARPGNDRSNEQVSSDLPGTMPRRCRRLENSPAVGGANPRLLGVVADYTSIRSGRIFFEECQSSRIIDICFGKVQLGRGQ